MKGHTYSKRRPFMFPTVRVRTSTDYVMNRCNEVVAINNAFLSASKLKVGIESRALKAAAKRANRGYVSDKKVYK